MSLLLLTQAQPDLAAQLDRIVLAQFIIAAVAAIFGLIGLGAALVALLVLRRLDRAARRLERSLGPRTEPILHNVEQITADLRHISDSLRRDYAGIHEAIEDAERQIRDAVDAAGERVRHLGAVLQVVQEEAESVLLDAAATARGVHTTAEALRGARLERRRDRIRGAADD